MKVVCAWCVWEGKPSCPTWLSENHVIELDGEIVVHDAAQLLGP